MAFDKLKWTIIVFAIYIYIYIYNIYIYVCVWCVCVCVYCIFDQINAASVSSFTDVLLQSGKHIHTAAGIWTCHRISPQTPAQPSGAQQPVRAVNTHTHTHTLLRCR